VDTHCHLDEILTNLKVFPPYERAATDRETIFGAGCEAVVAQFCDPAAFSPSFAVYPDLLGLPGVYAAFGIHPHHARYWSDDIAARVLEALTHERAVAYGEIGLDFKVNRSPPDAQRECFRAQLRLALSLDPPKPVVLHCAHAEAEMLAILLGRCLPSVGGASPPTFIATPAMPITPPRSSRPSRPCSSASLGSSPTRPRAEFAPRSPAARSRSPACSLRRTVPT